MPGTKRAHAALELIHASMSAIRQPTRPGDSNPGRGCLIAAVGSDIGRQPRTVRRAFTKGLESLIEGLGSFVTGRSPAARRKQALATLAGRCGAPFLSRAINESAPFYPNLWGARGD